MNVSSYGNQNLENFSLGLKMILKLMCALSYGNQNLENFSLALKMILKLMCVLSYGNQNLEKILYYRMRRKIRSR